MVVAGSQTVRYAITNLSEGTAGRKSGERNALEARWLAALHRWAKDGVDFVQLREKALPAGEIFTLAEQGVRFLGNLPTARNRPCLLVNSRADIAAAAGLGGVHLTARLGELRPEQVRGIFGAAGLTGCTVSMSCHNLGEVRAARDAGADLILFGPVFEKRVGDRIVVAGTGLEELARAADLARPVPLLALGGVTPATAPFCLEAGAAGTAGIRLFRSDVPGHQGNARDRTA